MTDRTTVSSRSEAFEQTMSEQMQRLVRHLSAWVQAEQHSLQAMEEQVLRVLHELGTSVLAELLPLASSTSMR